MERMRRLVCEFYDGMNFGKLVKRHPRLKGTITDMLIGDIFREEVDVMSLPSPNCVPNDTPNVHVRLDRFFRTWFDLRHCSSSLTRRNHNLCVD